MSPEYDEQFEGGENSPVLSLISSSLLNTFK